MPRITGFNVKDNACVRMDEFLLWLAFVVAAMVLMAGLYSRIVYTLWFKRDDHDNQLAFQQRVSVKVEGLHIRESRNIVMFVMM